MLNADKDALLAEVRRNYYALREKEMFFLNRNFDSIGQQAALITGFIVVTLTNLVIPTRTPLFLKGGFFLTLCATLSFGLVAVSNSTLINVYGQGKALRGTKRDSIVSVVDGMREERAPVYLAFILSVVMFQLMTIAVSWIEMETELAIACTAIMVGGMIYIAICGRRIYNRFKANSDSAKTQPTTLHS